MSHTIAEIGEEIKEEFGMFEDWMDKYSYLIELGKALPLIEVEYKTDEYKVRGCQSQVWLRSDLNDDHLYYKADSDALITKGLIALLVRALSGQKPDDIVKADLAFIDEIGMREHLSPNRSNGLNAMVKKMKLLALTQSSNQTNQEA